MEKKSTWRRLQEISRLNERTEGAIQAGLVVGISGWMKRGMGDPKTG